MSDAERGGVEAFLETVSDAALEWVTAARIAAHDLAGANERHSLEQARAEFRSAIDALRARLESSSSPTPSPRADGVGAPSAEAMRLILALSYANHDRVDERKIEHIENALAAYVARLESAAASPSATRVEGWPTDEDVRRAVREWHGWPADLPIDDTWLQRDTFAVRIRALLASLPLYAGSAPTREPEDLSGKAAETVARIAEIDAEIADLEIHPQAHPLGDEVLYRQRAESMAHLNWLRYCAAEGRIAKLVEQNERLARFNYDEGNRHAAALRVQACPVCNGQGLVSRPPHVAGDVATWVSADNSLHDCRACGGTGYVRTGSAPPSVAGVSDTERLDWLNGRLSWFVTVGPAYDHRHANIREAIDASRTAPTEEKA